MNKLAALFLTAALAACSAVPQREARAPDTRALGAQSSPDDDVLRGGHATPEGAAFLGFHGPVYRMTPRD